MPKKARAIGSNILIIKRSILASIPIAKPFTVLTNITICEVIGGSLVLFFNFNKDQLSFFAFNFNFCTIIQMVQLISNEKHYEIYTQHD